MSNKYSLFCSKSAAGYGLGDCAALSAGRDVSELFLPRHCSSSSNICGGFAQSCEVNAPYVQIGCNINSCEFDHGSDFALRVDKPPTASATRNQKLAGAG